VAASQFGSRLLRLYQRDRTTALIMGLFVGSFVYLISVVAGIPPASALTDTPQFATSLGLLLALIAFGSIIVLVNHIGVSLQAPYIAAAAGSELLRSLHGSAESYRRQKRVQRLPDQVRSPDAIQKQGTPVYARRAGYIQHLETERFMPLAERHDLTILLVRQPGDFIQPGDLIAYAVPADRVDDEVVARLCDTFTLGNQRTPRQDLKYAVRQLAEVAVRAMSPAINDPYTAINCLDHLGHGLSTYADHDLFRASEFYGKDGRLRLILSPVKFGELLDVAFNMLRRVSSNYPDVLLAILKTIETIGARTPRAAARAELLRHVELVKAECRASALIDWDKQRVIRRCGQLAAALKAVPSPRA
jgi:uncharacterized membrane protein